MTFAWPWWVVGTVLLGASVAIVRALASAPAGYQDERGFHFGKPPGDSSDAGLMENPG